MIPFVKFDHKYLVSTDSNNIWSALTATIFGQHRQQLKLKLKLKN